MYHVNDDVAPSLSTFFYTKLIGAGPTAAARWVRNLTSCQHLIVPLHISWVFFDLQKLHLGFLRNVHWALGVVMNLNSSSQKQVFFFICFGKISHSFKEDERSTTVRVCFGFSELENGCTRILWQNYRVLWISYFNFGNNGVFQGICPKICRLSHLCSGSSFPLFLAQLRTLILWPKTISQLF